MADLYQNRGLSGIIKGMSFAELAAAKTKQPDNLMAGKDGGGIEAGTYMGEYYQERLSKITDKNAANAFRQAYAMKMAGGTRNDFPFSMRICAIFRISLLCRT